MCLNQVTDLAVYCKDELVEFIIKSQKQIN